MPTFRLDTEPWIPIVWMDGTAGAVSLREVFTRSDQIAALAGTPLEVAAITRFLLAIVHLVDTPASLDAWTSLWRQRGQLMQRCAQYVAAQGGVWDLFHPQHPFGQVPNLKGTENPAHLLIYEAARKNNPLLVDHSKEGSPRPVPPAALARGLITANAYAGSSGGGYRSGPLVMRIVAILSGPTLAQTLLLNLLVQKEPISGFDWRTYGHPAAGNYPDLVRRYLWTSRRVRFISDDHAACVSGMMLSPGDDMPEAARETDPMVAVRLDAQGKKYVPLRLEVGRAFWRSAHVLLNWHEDAHPLAALDQLHKLRRRDLIAADQTVSMRVCGVGGEAQGPATQLWRDERLPFGLSVITDERRYAQLVQAVNSAEDMARTTRRRIYLFAQRYLQSGMASEPSRDDVKKLADELAPDLADFWSTIAQDGERIASDDFNEHAWARLLKEAQESAFVKAIERLRPDARRFRAQFASDMAAQSGRKEQPNDTNQIERGSAGHTAHRAGPKGGSRRARGPANRSG